MFKRTSQSQFKFNEKKRANTNRKIDTIEETIDLEKTAKKVRAKIDEANNILKEVIPPPQGFIKEDFIRLDQSIEIWKELEKIPISGHDEVSPELIGTLKSTIEALDPRIRIKLYLEDVLKELHEYRKTESETHLRYASNEIDNLLKFYKPIDKFKSELSTADIKKLLHTIENEGMYLANSQPETANKLAKMIGLIWEE